MNLRRLEDTDLKQYFVILSLLLREFKKGEAFASLLNIHNIRSDTSSGIKDLFFVDESV